MIGRWVAASAVAALGLAAASQDRGGIGSEAERVEALIRPYVEARLYNGVVLVTRGDSVVLERAYGVADYALGTPMSIDFRFQIGSITKDVTATAVRLLVADGDVVLDAPASRYLPPLSAHPGITVRHLLDHAHGLPDWADLPDARRWEVAGAPLAETVARLASREASFPPGTRREYGSTGYLILARLIEVVSGQSYYDFVAQRVLAPAGMAETGPRRDPLPTPRLVRGYVNSGTADRVRDPRSVDPSMGTGTSALVSSARDLLRWSRVDDSRSTWARGVERGRAIEWTAGMTGGYVARIHQYPAEGLTIVFLSNIYNAAFRPLLPALAEIFLGPTEARRPIPPPTLSSHVDALDTSALIGHYRCEEQFAFTVFRTSGELALRIDGKPGESYAVWPLDPLRFFVPTDFATVEIARSAYGERRATYGGGFEAACRVEE